MTLKDYTDFVVKFAITLRPRLPNAMPALATAREKEQLQALIEELPSLIGPENWEKLTDIFMKKVGWPEGFDKYAVYVFNHILWNGDKFTETLAEFCEPLIERTAEKPEGGQDAAKA